MKTKIAHLAQANFFVDDVDGNADKMVYYAQQARLEKAQLLIFSEKA